MTIQTRRRLSLACTVLLAAAAFVLWRSPSYGAEAPVIIAPPAVDNAKAAGAPQTAVLAGGCFWGVQGVFQHVRGVQSVVSGYAGGDKSTAQYETVSSGTTGHAESVKITFDPAQITYGQLLQIAFSVVFDPTKLNGKAPMSVPSIGRPFSTPTIRRKKLPRATLPSWTKRAPFPVPS